jgi:hypothetical protein
MPPAKLIVNGKKVFQKKGNESKRDWKKIIVLDIETWGLDATEKSFAIGVCYDGERFIRFTNLDDMRNYIINYSHSGYSFYGHNSGSYDYYILFGNLFDYFGSQNVIINGSKFIMAKKKIRERIRNGKKCNEYIYFYDSLNILMSSVADLGLNLGKPKHETPKKFIDGYPKVIDEQDWKYCEQDCTIVYEMLKKVYDVTGCLKATIASIALDTFSRHFQQSDYFIDEQLDLHFRRSYYGGRVECYKLGKIPANKYGDINSLYPYVMLKNDYPNPGKLYHQSEIPIEKFMQILDEYEGTANLTVKHLQSDIGFLPVRIDGKLCFPIGEFTSDWNFPEIRFAIKQGVIKILKVNDVVYSERMESPFKDYVAKFWELKNSSDGAEKIIYKYLLNSLYGKFGEYRDFEDIYSKQYNPEFYQMLIEKNPGKKINIIPIAEDREDIYYRISNNSDIEALRPHTIFGWASYVTSYARIRNIEIQIRLRNESNVYYTDTDSFVCDSIPDDLISDELGYLKIEDKEFTEIHGNKWYEYEDTKTSKMKLKVKGVNKNHSQNGNEFKFKSIIKLKSAIRRNIPVGTGITVTKMLQNDYDKRIVTNDGYTVPIVLNATNCI